jgi:hypothetical protein
MLWSARERVSGILRLEIIDFAKKTLTIYIMKWQNLRMKYRSQLFSLGFVTTDNIELKTR